MKLAEPEEEDGVNPDFQAVQHDQAEYGKQDDRPASEGRAFAPARRELRAQNGDKRGQTDEMKADRAYDHGRGDAEVFQKHERIPKAGGT